MFNQARIDPKWADPGRVGIYTNNDNTFVFVVLRSFVDHADILVLDTNMTYVYTIGSTIAMGWDATLWHLAKEPC